MTRPVRLLLIASSFWYFSEGLLGPLFAIGVLIANFVAFQALFVTMGLISLVATVVQVRLSFMEERIAA